LVGKRTLVQSLSRLLLNPFLLFRGTDQVNLTNSIAKATSQSFLENKKRKKSFSTSSTTWVPPSMLTRLSLPPAS
jgi:hypothetical protein